MVSWLLGSYKCSFRTLGQASGPLIAGQRVAPVFFWDRLTSKAQAQVLLKPPWMTRQRSVRRQPRSNSAAGRGELETCKFREDERSFLPFKRITLHQSRGACMLASSRSRDPSKRHISARKSPPWWSRSLQRCLCRKLRKLEDLSWERWSSVHLLAEIGTLLGCEGRKPLIQTGLPRQSNKSNSNIQII